jgi:cystathionine gamma-lyase
MTTNKKKQHFSTRCIHAGDTTDPATGAVMPPIVTSTTFEYERFGTAREHIYARTSNPTRDALERCVADLESGVRALAYASGQAASAGVLDLLDAGDHVIAPTVFYGGSRRLLHEVRRRVAGLAIDFVDMRDPVNVAAAIRPGTRLVWVETPANPLLGIVDIAAVVEIAHRHKALVCVDNTWATPCFQRPLELGADIVMHSATKYLGGHSDVLGGVNVVADADLGQRMVSLRSGSGGVMGPFDAYLVLRGIKTLSLRMAQHAANALAVARCLEAAPQVENVLYPGLESHPQHALARKQMSGFGAVVTCGIRGGKEAAGRFLDALQLFAIAESLGGVESLVGHPQTMSHSSVPAHDRIAMGIADNMVRLSVGIEDLDDLVTDVRQALAACER